MKPLLLLDVDGVLNRFVGEDDLEKDFKAGPDGKGTFRIRVPEGTKARMERLTEAFDVLWFTTWEEHARTEIAPVIGLPDWEAHAFSRANYSGRRCWKMDDFEELAASQWAGRPIAWVDDDLCRHADQIVANVRTDDGTPTLFVCPNPDIGLTEDHERELLEWAAELA